MNISDLRTREINLTSQIIRARRAGEVEMEKVFEGRRDIVRREIEKELNKSRKQAEYYEVKL